MTTSDTPITVVIPVGPYEANKRWLGECLESVRAQSHPAAQVLIIDDQAGFPLDELTAMLSSRIDVWRTPWLSGVAHSFNFGVALAAYDLVVMLGSDDVLEPWALADCARAWERHADPLGYYHLDVRYLDTGEEQSVPCGAAMVTKALWRHTGGFPVQAALGASDTMLISILMGQKGRAGNLRSVESARPPYLYRRHSETDTVRNFWRFNQEIASVRDTLTREWEPSPLAAQQIVGQPV